MRTGRYHAQELLRLIDGVGAGASAVMGGGSLASDIAHERLKRIAYGTPAPKTPTVVFAEDGS